MSIAEKLTTIAENQQKVYDAGFTAGQAQGGGGYDEGYEAGQQAEYDRFWDDFQQNGIETSYQGAFASRRWTDEIYNPKYPIRCNGNYGAYQLFNSNNVVTDTKVPIELNGAHLSSTFASASRLVTIRLLKLVDVPTISSAFHNCSALKNITIEGSIDVNFNISATAVLTNESVQSIIDHLKDLTGQATQTLGLHTDVMFGLTDEQFATIAAKNWTL